MRSTATAVTTFSVALALMAAPAVAHQGSGAAQGQGKGQGLENPNIVEFTSEGHEFLGLPEEIPSGWTTFRYHNNSHGEHFAYIADLPEGKTSRDSLDEVAPVFQDAMDLIVEGQVGEGFAQFGRLPAWFAETVPMGGPGIVAPGNVAETTVYLEPGNYQIECYVKSDGVFHTFTMLEDLTVTDDANGAREPSADFAVTLTNDGIEIDGEIRPGERTFEVDVQEQTVHGNGLGHDVHLARIDDDTDLDELADWMNWVNPDGLDVTPPAEFLGGAQTMTAGSTAYVSVHLTPGEYVFISEVDNPDEKGMLRTVTIP